MSGDQLQSSLGFAQYAANSMSLISKFCLVLTFAALCIPIIFPFYWWSILFNQTQIHNLILLRSSLFPFFILFLVQIRLDHSRLLRSRSILNSDVGNVSLLLKTLCAAKRMKTWKTVNEALPFSGAHSLGKCSSPNVYLSWTESRNYVIFANFETTPLILLPECYDKICQQNRWWYHQLADWHFFKLFRCSQFRWGVTFN